MDDLEKLKKYKEALGSEDYSFAPEDSSMLEVPELAETQDSENTADSGETAAPEMEQDSYIDTLRKYKQDIIEERRRALDEARQSEDDKTMQWLTAIGKAVSARPTPIDGYTPIQISDHFLKDTKDKRVASAQKNLVEAIDNYSKFEKKAQSEGLRIMNVGSDIVAVDRITGEVKSRIKGVVEPKGMTEYQKLRLEQENKRAKNLEERRKTERAQRLDDKIYKVTEDYEKNATVRAMNKEELSFDQADNLIKSIESGNEVALGALGTKMARAMGEVGVLTDTDVERYIMAQSLVQKAKDKYGKNFLGQISEETLKDIKEVSKKMKTGFLKKKNELYKRYVEKAYLNYGKQAGLSKDQVGERFGFVPKKQEFRRKTKDGRTAIFDENKKFLRYEE